MPDDCRSIEEVLAEIDREVAELPPGSDLAGYITRRHRELGQMLARRVAQGRQDASKQAAFPPSAVPEVRPRGDAPGEQAQAQDDAPARG